MILQENFRPSEPSMAGHVFQGQREHPAALCAAALAGGQHGQGQGLAPGSYRASAVNCVQNSWKMPSKFKV